jgi:hypothetical protein
MEELESRISGIRAEGKVVIKDSINSLSHTRSHEKGGKYLIGSRESDIPNWDHTKTGIDRSGVEHPVVRIETEFSWSWAAGIRTDDRAREMD